MTTPSVAGLLANVGRQVSGFARGLSDLAQAALPGRRNTSLRTASLRKGSLHGVSVAQYGAAMSLSQQPALLEKWGDALVVPTEPASIFEHAVVARPTFENRQLPPSNYMFWTGGCNSMHATYVKSWNIELARLVCS